MKVLWLSNIDLRNKRLTASGTWMSSMYLALKRHTSVKVCANITTYKGYDPEFATVGDINHYYLPNNYMNSENAPESKAKDFIKKVILKEKPDLIHIWGTEKCWGLTLDEDILKTIPVLLEIQGLMFFLGGAPFYGGLSDNEVRKMRGLVELRYPQAKLENQKKRFVQCGEREKLILQRYQHINTQSEWVRDILLWYAPNATTYKTDIILRDSFLRSELWTSVHKRGNAPILFTTTSRAPYKGLHFTLKAFALVLQKYPNAKLRVAGLGFHPVKWKNSGYLRYLMDLMKELKIENNVDMLDSLDESALLEEMYHADVYVTSTYVESYCLALAEPLAVGMPCVAPYTSALPDLITSGENGILYPPTDYHACASEIIKILRDEERGVELGREAASRQRGRSEAKRVAQNQEKIYNEVIEAYGNTKVIDSRD